MMMGQRWKIRANGEGINRKPEKYRVAVVRKKKAAQKIVGLSQE